MHLFAKIAGAFVVLLAFLTTADGKSTTAAEAQALIQRANEVSDVWSGGAVRLGLRVKFFAVAAGNIEAKYEKIAASPQQWRTTFSSPEYNSITVGGNSRVWEWSDAPEKPIRVRQFERALAALSQFVVSQNLEYALRERKLEGHERKQPCVEIKDGRRLIQDCFDRATGVLLIAQEENWTFLYSDYKPLGKKLFPQSILVFETFTLVSVAQVLEIEPAPTPDPSLFEPIPGADVYPVCPEGLGFPLGAKGGKLVKEVSPMSRRLPPNSGILSNDMIVSGIVGRDGKFHNIRAEGTNPLIRDATLEAVRQWQFEPFTVCGYPVEMPVSFTLNFSNSGRYVGHIGP